LHVNFLQRLYVTILRLVLRIFFRLLYHEMAWTYNWVSSLVSAGHWDEWVRQAIPFIHGKHILELGFGPGNLLLELANSRKTVVGVDRSFQMAHRLRSKLSAKKPGQLYGYAQSANILQGDGTLLPFTSGCFDSVIATFPTEYIFLPATAAEISRVLAPDGCLILVPTAWITGKSWRERAAAFLFWATGQSEPEQTAWHTPFHELGMRVLTTWIDLGHSQVCVITAEKTPVGQPMVGA